MAVVELKGRITPQGTLEVGLPAGDVSVRIQTSDMAMNDVPPMTYDEALKLMSRPPRPRDEFLAWLRESSVVEPWGGLADDDDAGEHIHVARRKSALNLDEGA